jgi:hypothetical protein
MNAIVPATQANVDAYRASTDAAAMCRQMVIESAMNIQGRKYVKVEGWQAIAIAHGCTGSARSVERVEGGVRAIGEVRRMSDGAVIAEAEGFVGEDEPTWFGGEVENKWGKKTLQKRPDYAIRAMAQTRAISRACRSAFAHVVVMMNAGLSTTPAEEVPLEGFSDGPRDVSPSRNQSTDTSKRHNANQCKTVTTTRPDTGEVVAKAALAAKLAHEMTDIMDVAELLAFRRLWEPEVATWPLKWEEKFWSDFDIHHEDLRGLTATEDEFRSDGDEAVAGDDDDIFPGDRPATAIVREQLHRSVADLGEN